MSRYRYLPAALAVLAAIAGCVDRDLVQTNAKTGVRQTAFPGQITAGGGTSGAVMARTARPETDATYAGGTPGIAGGSGGTTGGAATAGTVVESGQGPSSGTTPVTGIAPGQAGATSVAAPAVAPPASAQAATTAPGAAPAVGASPRGGTAPTSGEIPTDRSGQAPSGQPNPDRR